MQITRHGLPQDTVGTPPSLGHALPNFSVVNADGKEVSTADFAGRYNLISVVPDINTRVCSISTKQFNQAMDEFDGIGFYTISTNTTAQQANWCAAEDVHHIQLLSDDDANFGSAMGLYVADNHTDARSVWIVAPDGHIAYRELILEQTQEPDYGSALAYLEAHQQH